MMTGGNKLISTAMHTAKNIFWQLRETAKNKLNFAGKKNHQK
jgi:hypothetical protein